MDLSQNSTTRNCLNQEFLSSRNKSFRDWLLKSFSKEEHSKFKEEFYKDLQLTHKLESFASWFLKFYLLKQEAQIRVLEEHFKQWKTQTGAIVRSIYPPTDPLRLSGISTSNLEAVAFIKPNEVQDDSS